MSARITQRELESYLWGAAVVLRGLIDAGDYKQYIFPLVFLKRISDVYDEEHAAAMEIYGDEELADVRNRHMGFVFQFHHLLREFTALENVMMPALIAGVAPVEAAEQARALLADVGVDHREDHKPRQLSGGEQQRVAVARALANEPLVLLADEPSGNLDTETSERLHELLFRLREQRGLSMVIVTYNGELAARADRILELRGARLQPAPQV